MNCLSIIEAVLLIPSWMAYAEFQCCLMNGIRVSLGYSLGIAQMPLALSIVTIPRTSSRHLVLHCLMHMPPRPFHREIRSSTLFNYRAAFHSLPIGVAFWLACASNPMDQARPPWSGLPMACMVVLQEGGGVIDRVKAICSLHLSIIKRFDHASPLATSKVPISIPALLLHR